ncbi:MAG TPA: hypothetical protein VGL65_08050 [Gemmatimonadales bacterium]|jgi:hypothetical protein
MPDANDSPKKPRPPELQELREGRPLPDELTGRASGSADSLSPLFDNDTADHFADGFRGGSNSDPDSDLDEDPPPLPNNDGDVTAD